MIRINEVEVNKMRKAIQISENIYWVGVHDFNCRHFHGDLYPINEGTSYNAYLIVDEQVTLIDTVENEYIPILLERIESVIGNRPIDNIIVQHAEPDHSGGFLEVMERYPNAKAYASNAGIRIMMQEYFKEISYTKVVTNDTLCTGKYHLRFIEMPMIHWPDNMMTYVEESHVLFSNDAFGQHIVSYQLFDQAHEMNFCIEKAKEYFANIVAPYALQVKNKLNQIMQMNLEIEAIAPAHGIIWKAYIPEILKAYQNFSAIQLKNKAVILYESVWHHTKEMAETLAEGLGQNGVEVHLYQVSSTMDSIMMKELLDAKAILVGSGNYNNMMAPQIAGILEKLNSCKFKNRLALGFSSYGWANLVGEQINQKLKANQYEIIQDSFNINYAPSTSDLEEVYHLGETIALKIKESLQ